MLFLKSMDPYSNYESRSIRQIQIRFRIQNTAKRHCFLPRFGISTKQLIHQKDFKRFSLEQ